VRHQSVERAQENFRAAVHHSSPTLGITFSTQVFPGEGTRLGSLGALAQRRASTLSLAQGLPPGQAHDTATRIPILCEVFVNIRERIAETEREFPRLFSGAQETPFGILFYNKDNKESHDSNHAVIYPERIGDLSAVLGEIREFYASRGISPRVYQTFSDGYFKAHQDVFSECGFRVEVYGSTRLFLLQAENQIRCGDRLEVKLVTEWDERIATDIFRPDGDTFTPTVICNSMRSKDYYCFAGYLNDEAVSTASVYVSPYGIARLDSVETAAHQRGKGYSREVMRYVIEYYNKYINAPFYLWPANATAERIYTEAGFRYLFEMEAASAWI
jgi:GNAT superfamily N-acetyltransferase